MRIKVISFTKNGIELSVQLRKKLSEVLYYRNRVAPAEDIHCKLFTACKNVDYLPPHVTFTNESLKDFAEDAFKHYDALLFIGACGIAVRAIAPCVKDKFQDVPVLVMDEVSNVVIPILAGHLGGANRLAGVIAKQMDLQAVITTATDLHKKFAVDLFAADNDLLIEKREGIAMVSAKILSGGEITVCVEGDYAVSGKVPEQLVVLPYEENRDADILISSDPSRTNGSIVLRPKRYVVGIGCKRGTSFEKIEKFTLKTFKENHLDEKLICAIASIDLKKKEEGIHQFSKRYKIPFIMYDANTLESLDGDFHASEFVKDTVGVDNVCERSAVAAAGDGAELILEKTANDGMTIAVAKRSVKLCFANASEDALKNSSKDSNGNNLLQKEEVSKSFGISNSNEKGIIYAVGIGPGEEGSITKNALSVLEQSDVIVGYPVYLDLLPDYLKTKKLLSTPMRQEKERCVLAFEEAQSGKTVSMVCSGDAGVYGMASLLYEIGEEYPEIPVEVIPGITAATSGAALLGAPLNHDFCIISLSDLLTPWEKIEERLKSAAKGDFAIAIYNPSSKKRADYLEKACDILLEIIEPERPCGYVKNIGRDNTEVICCTLEELREKEVDMFTTVFIGNASTELIGGKLVTKRGYKLES